MKKVFKYTIPFDGSFGIELPIDSEILTVQMQRNAPCIWVLVDPARPMTTRYFRLAGTGHEIDVFENFDTKYIGSFQMAQETLIFHLFEVKNKQEVTSDD